MIVFLIVAVSTGSTYASCSRRVSMAKAAPRWRTPEPEVGGAVDRGRASFTWCWWAAARCRCSTPPATSTSSSSSLPSDTRLEYFEHHYFTQSRFDYCISLCDCYTYRATVTSFLFMSMPAGFRRHLVGKALRNIWYCDIAWIRFVGKLMIKLSFS